LRLLATIAAALLLAPLLSAQAAAPESTDPGLSVKVAVWGQVNRPGRYFLNGTSDLFELLSAAGGPTAGADLGRILLIRERDGSRTRLSVNRIAASGRPFMLTANDVVIVPESFWSRFRAGLPAVSAAAALTNVAVTLLLLVQR